MPYTEAVLTEVARIGTILPTSIFHATSRDTSLHGYDIPEGTTVMPNLWSVHHDPEHFPNPGKFDPGRFLDAQGQYQRDDHVMPFGIAPVGVVLRTRQSVGPFFAPRKPKAGRLSKSVFGGGLEERVNGLARYVSSLNLSVTSLFSLESVVKLVAAPPRHTHMRTPDPEVLSLRTGDETMRQTSSLIKPNS
uniref:Cytochrome P450 n=1 Tax=Branchiostoma floridae TaxID=7739 RepID=C3XRE4_BRAFL|eukprot:XP_002613253.1 hypothetical protein BRAFLDRAFT_68218 [Branchiostoma floridae]